MKLRKKVADTKDLIIKIKASLKEKEAAEKEFMAKFKKIFNERNALLKKIDVEENRIIKKEEELRAVEHKNTTYNLDLARIKAELGAYEEEFKQYGDVKLLKPSSDMKKELWSAEQKLSQNRKR